MNDRCNGRCGSRALCSLVHPVRKWWCSKSLVANLPVAWQLSI
jgi:hypothetical protein